jgi:prepilin-type N-terminal cleavage/methylation domain-containing protein
MNHVRRRGFSLVELLIVLLIIVLLVAIILPAVNRAREMSRRSVCISHIGQLTAAWLAYVGDNDGHLPNSGGSPAWDGALTQEQLALEGTKALWTWHDPSTTIPRGQLWPYLRNLKTYTCPDDPQEFHWVFYAVAAEPRQTTAPGGTGTSYGVNPLLGDLGNPFPSLPLHVAWGKKPHTAYHYNQASSVSRIKSPVHTYVFIEDIDWDGRAFPSVPIYPDHLSTTEPNGRLHLNASGKTEGCSISFADGHAIFWNYAFAGASPGGDPESPFREEFTQGNGPDVMQLAAWSGGPIPP